ncbi:Uncharacterised protein [Veillonella ratti]|uniref:ECF transporter S component n=1 Tax=Veillonella ratti TaxID=103892 RepID=A0A6N3BE83_9FIRM
MNTRIITGTGLLLALALLSQSLRLIIPLPNMVSMFLIGSLVGLCMLVAAMRYGLASGLGIAWATPVIAFMQAMLPFAPFVPLVALGNTVFVILGYLLKNQSVWLQALVCSVAKCVVLYCSFGLLFVGFAVPYPIGRAVLFMMSWPQIVTGTLAVVGARFLLNHSSLGGNK